MEWPEPLEGGYHYMKLEGKFDSAGTIKNYQAHTGPLMRKSYCIHIDLTTSDFSITTHQTEIILVMDVNQWWKEPADLNLDDISGIMENAYYQLQLKENGTDVFSVSSVR